MEKCQRNDPIAQAVTIQAPLSAPAVAPSVPPTLHTEAPEDVIENVEN